MRVARQVGFKTVWSGLIKGCSYMPEMSLVRGVLPEGKVALPEEVAD